MVGPCVFIALVFWTFALMVGAFHAALHFTRTPAWIAFGSRLVS
jgi:hypothetical protein